MKDALKKIVPRMLAAAFVSLAFVSPLSLLVAAKPASAPKVSTPERATPSTLAQYRERVRESVAPLEELAEFCEQLKRAEKPEVWEKEDFDPDVALQLPRRETATLSKVRRLLPPKERVEWAGGSIEVDNSWLYPALEEYGRASDNGKRADALRGVAEKLRALASRLDELEAGAEQQDKDAERGRLNAILRDPEFNRKAEQGGALQRIIEQIVEWIREIFRGIFPDAGPIRPGSNPRFSQLAQVIVLALCLAVLAYVGWRFWSRRARDPKTLKLRRKARVVLGERLEADQTASDLLDAAERLARAGDLRGAIRKAYIALLCELGDRGIIRLEQHKTNRDYLQAVRRAAPQSLYTEMLPLTFNFELHWYGLQDASETDWTDFRARCRQAIKQSGV
ncbi:MAG TPA: DUF4129 domain-containing protein [Pyrinomonadaceae bacterium]|nr:DUF4129 domain-containing protein [Pyrinomonadaceae bacterium]